MCVQESAGQRLHCRTLVQRNTAWLSLFESLTIARVHFLNRFDRCCPDEGGRTSMTWRALPHFLYALPAKQRCHDRTLLRLIAECLTIGLLD